MQDFSEIIAATERWLQSSTDRIRADPNALYMPIKYDGWSVNSDGSFEAHPVTLITSDQFQKIVFDDNPTWKDLTEIALGFPVVRASTTQSLWVGDLARGHQTLDRLFWSLLPSPTIVDGVPQFVQLRPIELPEFIAELISDECQVNNVWPIQGLQTAAPLELQEGVKFRALTTMEKLNLLRSGIIRSFTQTRLSREHSNWFGLHRIVKRKKFDFSALNDDALNKYWNGQRELVEDFLSAASLVVGRKIWHPGGSGRPPHLSYLQFRGGEASQSILNDAAFFSATENTPTLAGKLAQDLKEVWRIMLTSNKDVHRAIATAIRRLYFASTRFKPEDELVDLMIAAESLFGGDGNSEKTYRLSISASLVLGSSESERSELCKKFKIAYAQRSTIVHGGSLDSDKTTKTIEFLRGAVSTAIMKIMRDESLSTDFPNWHRLLFRLSSRSRETTNAPTGAAEG